MGCTGWIEGPEEVSVDCPVPRFLGCTVVPPFFLNSLPLRVKNHSLRNGLFARQVPVCLIMKGATSRHGTYYTGGRGKPTGFTLIPLLHVSYDFHRWVSGQCNAAHAHQCGGMFNSFSPKRPLSHLCNFYIEFLRLLSPSLILVCQLKIVHDRQRPWVFNV